ncbi:hypothetical protein Y032_0020g143 [Ancylostoma ceylanicum]|uniref:Mediator of RNA polymerase II transcription subunit 17 n=1 Tax=Ancylostoma ceylanicum TaxID=53326 RepID=A0A016V115_9BILA|nr:hypothetical protein Y032_0020g143 [Ancylostoma ceylanicum]
MYPSGSGTFTGGPGAVRKGADISLEAVNEWKIQEIGYDGVEKYIKPPSFSDNVGKLARQVDWQKLIGSDAVYDNPNAIKSETEEEEEPGSTTYCAFSFPFGQVQICRTSTFMCWLQTVETKPVEIEERVIPEAGPWHNVAKYLHESLQQFNVLLDNLAIMRATDYMKPLTILDPIHAESAPMQAENAAASKATQWVWKRKALLEAMSVLELAQRLRNVEVEDEAHQQKSQFFMELTKMREYWRVRKTGDHIYGDLGYRIFGSKYNPRELFDITRRSLTPGTSFDASTSVLQVSVPRDLTRRSTLAVSIVKDDYTNRDLFASLDDHQFEYMKVDSSKIESIHWASALKWAQETLICKDIFNTLCSDAVQMRNRLSTVRDGVLLVSLYNDYLLRVELKYHPFREGELIEEGCPYLNRSLREMMVSQECTRWVRPQTFVSLPLTNLSEALDARGPRAFTAREIESRAHKPQFLLEKLIVVASHYSLVKMARETLEEFMSSTRDPQVHWRWLRCSPISSQFMVILTNRNFDYVVGKVTYYIRVTADSVCLISKDGHSMDCYRDPNQLMYALKYMACTFSVTSISTLGKVMWFYQLLHANMNATDEHGRPAPTLYMLNPDATMEVFVRFGIDQNPLIQVRKFQGATKYEDQVHVPFTTLNYDRLRGSTLCRKMDNLFAAFRDIDE